MKVAITGGTGFVGGHLARRLAEAGHEIRILTRRPISPIPTDVPDNVRYVIAELSSVESLANAFRGCDVIAHCAGINREIGNQTYRAVHIDGTRNVVTAQQQSGVPKILLMSFLRARPRCGSAYHESKWDAEEIVRTSGLDYTVIKAGMVYGRGDHMLDHLSHSLYTLPLFATVGCREAPIRPLAVDDLIDVLQPALIDGRMSRATIAITGAEELSLSEAVRRVARVTGRPVLIVRAPVWVHTMLSRLFEWTMKVPLVARAQVRILAEGVTASASTYCGPPADLIPTRRFTDDHIRRGLPAPGAFGLHDLRCFA